VLVGRGFMVGTQTIPWTTEMRRVLALLQEHPVLQRLQAFAAQQAVQLFVVGGTVRDVCLGRTVHDIDVAMAGDVMRFARRFAHDLGAAYVPLDPERGEARVVYRKQLDVDFARFKGDDVAADLRHRDFTINALACPLSTFLTHSAPALIDPCHGWRDLRARLLRLVSPRSLHDDPLRQLRAFRLAATLGLAIEPETLEAIKPVVPRLTTVAAERIASESLQLFGAAHSGPHVMRMARLTLLDTLFPELAATRHISRNPEHAPDLFAHALHSYQAVEDLINAPEDFVPEIAAALRDYLSADEHPALLKWAALVHAIGQPSSIERGMIPEGSCMAAAECSAAAWVQVSSRLKLSKAHSEYVKLLLAHQGHPFELATLEAQGALTWSLVYHWGKAMGGDVLGALVLAIGDVLARHQRHPASHEAAAFAARATRLWERYRRRILPVLNGPRLVTGDDLRLIFGLTPGPRFKKLLDAVEMAHVEGQISNRPEALQWLERQLGKD
jgi:poly(A) polymerase